MDKPVLCSNPEIEDTIVNRRILFALQRNGYARQIGYKFWQVDWDRIARAFKYYKFNVRNIAEKSELKIKEWMKEADPNLSFFYEECPICKQFHEHNHAGLVIT